MKAPRPDILVTGFGPFPHVRVNPTETLARAVAGRLGRSGLRAEAIVLETSYAGGLPALRRALAERRPRAVLMLGLASRSRWIRVELFGRGRASALHPDRRGATPPASGPVSAASGPRRTTASAEMALACLRVHRLRCRTSASAGRYLCDASYALALAEAGAPVLFVHLPWPRPASGQRPASRVERFRPRRRALAAALGDIGRALARAGRRLS